MTNISNGGQLALTKAELDIAHRQHEITIAFALMLLELLDQFNESYEEALKAIPSNESRDILVGFMMGVPRQANKIHENYAYIIRD